MKWATWWSPIRLLFAADSAVALDFLSGRFHELHEALPKVSASSLIAGVERHPCFTVTLDSKAFRAHIPLGHSYLLSLP